MISTPTRPEERGNLIRGAVSEAGLVTRPVVERLDVVETRRGAARVKTIVAAGGSAALTLERRPNAAIARMRRLCLAFVCALRDRSRVAVSPDTSVTAC